MVVDGHLLPSKAVTIVCSYYPSQESSMAVATTPTLISHSYTFFLKPKTPNLSIIYLIP